MKNLINLKQNSLIEIDGKTYEVLTKTTYVTNSSTDEYIKYILSEHNILVVIPTDEMIYLGKIVSDFESKTTFSNTINYEGIQFEKVASDYQLVKSVDYGNPQDVEGEVIWADYASDNKLETYISCAWVPKTNSRADIVGTILEAKDIKIL